MQSERPQESSLVTGTEYLNDSNIKGKPGVCLNNLTQLHFLLNHFSKQNALFYRGTLSEGMMVLYFPPYFLLCLQEGIKQFFDFKWPLSQLQAPQLV